MYNSTEFWRKLTDRLIDSDIPADEISQIIVSICEYGAQMRIDGATVANSTIILVPVY